MSVNTGPPGRARQVVQQGQVRPIPDGGIARDGTRRFGFELRFSENFQGRLRFRMLRDEALQVTNGRVTQPKRMAPGQNRRWRIEVKPDSLADVVMTLPAGSVVTEAGRSLANTVTAALRNPVALSVADARANEADEALAFTVSLSRAASGTKDDDRRKRHGPSWSGCTRCPPVRRKPPRRFLGRP